jgi:PKD repeat protein
VLVADHSKVMPAQSDVMVASVRSFNSGIPASTTSVVMDYLTVKNHNKLEISIMSDSERVVASSAPLQQFSYSVAGVIAINTDLMVLDCLQLRSLYIQCASMGTTGVVTVQWCNEPTFAQPITATLLSEAGATSTTFNAAVMRATNVIARYCRLRLTTATTAGTTTINAWGAQTTYTPIVTTQPVSGTVTVNGTVTSTVTGGTVVGTTPTASILSSAATTNGTVVKASAGTIYGLTASNTGAAVAFLKLHNSTTVTAGTTAVALTVPIPAGGIVSFAFGTQGMRYGTGICFSITNLAADADTTAVTLNQVKVNLSFI